MPIPHNSEVVRGLRKLIEQFLENRLEGKLEKLSDDDSSRETLTEQFGRENWIADAARRVAQIQLVTHALKATHPDARGSSLYVAPADLNSGNLVGSGWLNESFQADVVGNAAALDVYKFLRLEFEGKALLERVLEQDENLISAFSDDRLQAEQWMCAFAAITKQRTDVSSHSRAKQVYFLVDEDPTDDQAYHLLSPLYATSLAHEVFLRIQKDRFGESEKEARKARWDKRWFDHGYYEYPELAVQKLGGTKPQNISQLNSERGGSNYLLASLPPQWHSREVVPPLNTDSAFAPFRYRSEVRRLVRMLARLLASDPARNARTRAHWDELIQDLCGELLHFAAELRTLPPGWSSVPECQLHEAEKFWLDPGCAEADSAFREKRKSTDWPSIVRHRFGNWLNYELSKVATLGDAEHRHWVSHLKHSDDWKNFLKDDKHWQESLDELERELEE